MFLNEARLAATLHHPNIAQVYDIGVDDGDYFFAMEYVHGEDLDHLVACSANEQGVPSRWTRRSRSSRGLCAGLHYAHEKVGADGKPLDIVHRDVSPSNVLVSYDGAVKLVDFGIARAAKQPTTTRGGLKGKIAYMSPEQCRGRRARPAQRHVLGRHDPLRADDRPAAVHRRDRVPAAQSDREPRRAAAERDRPGLSAGARADRAARARPRSATSATRPRSSCRAHIEDFAHESRLRVSPLVLARLMSTLFPARLEEWDAREGAGRVLRRAARRAHADRGRQDAAAERSGAARRDRRDPAHEAIVAEGMSATGAHRGRRRRHLGRPDTRGCERADAPSRHAEPHARAAAAPRRPAAGALRRRRRRGAAPRSAAPADAAARQLRQRAGDAEDAAAGRTTTPIRSGRGADPADGAGRARSARARRTRARCAPAPRPTPVPAPPCRVRAPTPGRRCRASRRVADADRADGRAAGAVGASRTRQAMSPSACALPRRATSDDELRRTRRAGVADCRGSPVCS